MDFYFLELLSCKVRPDDLLNISHIIGKLTCPLLLAILDQSIEILLFPVGSGTVYTYIYNSSNNTFEFFISIS